MERKNQNGKIGCGWTPEQTLQAIKEIVTALLGIILVAYTLFLASQVTTYVGMPEKISDAKDILMLMLGLAGVVVGYYFGHVPADARATQAQQQANAATAQVEQISAQAQSASDQVDQILSRIAAPTDSAARGTTAAMVTEDVAEGIKRVHDKLRHLIVQPVSASR